ncbi:HNH endonuclease signature motif containing protein [Nocardioides aestuarii]|uniref:DUF222 domain-containing protein n=1 Tax=Nocardioides aestuarii TaxID=252231 RepID=A0ABW4TP50_9ACTN
MADLDGVMWAARQPEELLAGIEEIQLLKARTAALEAELLAEVDAQAIPKKTLAWGSTTDWFAHLAGTTRRSAKRTVVNARRLTAERPATLDALRDGDVSPDQADVIVRAVDDLPLTGTLRVDAETHLIQEAGRLNASDLAKTARHLLDVVDPDKAERTAEAALDREERAAHLGRRLSITDDGAGGVHIRGRGTVEDAAALRAALLPFTKPAPKGAASHPSCGEAEDPRDHGTRLWDALVHLAQHALDTQVVPESHGTRPTVVVHIDADDLRSARGTATSDDGAEVTGSAVSRMACDADLVRVVLDADGCVLDVGRRHRLVTPTIWTALVARDHHCAFPGCTRPPVMCHAHHIRHWTDGGPTSLDNLVLLCGHHHRTVHHTPWQVRLSAADRRPEFLPPPKHARPAPEWIRHRPRRE